MPDVPLDDDVELDVVPELELELLAPLLDELLEVLPEVPEEDEVPLVPDDELGSPGPPTHPASVVAPKKSTAARERGFAKLSFEADTPDVSAPQNGQVGSLVRT